MALLCRFYGHNWEESPFLGNKQWCNDCGALEDNAPNQLSRSDTFLLGFLCGGLLMWFSIVVKVI